ncbi:MAG: response regulator [Gammaproteobacteria bacterium]
MKTILLVEDSPLDVELMLHAASYCNIAERIAVARDGVEALDYLLARGAHAGRTEGHPKLVLLDLHMPRLDGFEVLKTIRTHPLLSDIPVVVMTSAAEDADLRRASMLGIDELITKTLDFTVLVRTMARLRLQYLQ